MGHHYRAYRLTVTADADPSVLARQCGLLTMLPLITRSFQCRTVEKAEALSLQLVVVSDDREVDLLSRKIALLVLVQSVDVTIESTGARCD